MFGLGTKEIIIIGIIVIFFFGIKKSPQILKRIIALITEFKGLFQFKK